MTTCALALALLVGPATFALADTYKIDSQHTEVRFTWDHLGLSRQGGRFSAVEGKLEFDPEKPELTTADITLPLKSISTGIKKLDENLTSTKDFFDVAAHPFITFKSTSVRMKSDKTAEMEGELTINGIGKPVTLEVLWNFTGDHPLQSINPAYAGAYASGFSATTQIRRSDWGITRTIPFVSDELRITIETEVLRTAITEPTTDGLPSDQKDGETGMPGPKTITDLEPASPVAAPNAER